MYGTQNDREKLITVHQLLGRDIIVHEYSIEPWATGIDEKL